MCLRAGLIILYGLSDGRGIRWIDLAQDKDRWRTLVNAVMNLQVP
jgi:hypothetical protein